VDAGSALVLDSGSYTYIGSNCGIYVKNGGSLVIKNHAFVQIGSGGCGHGEIMVESGGFIHISEGAHLEFYKVIGDTSDKNIFNIRLQTSSESAFPGIQYLMDSVLVADTIVPANLYSFSLCGLDSINLPHGIVNREWGYANFLKPFATMQMRNDTLCPGEPLHLYLDRILNAAQTYIQICKLDTVNTAEVGEAPHWVDSCLVDSVLFDNTSTDPVCRPPHQFPPVVDYYFTSGSLHRITVKTWNDCGMESDSIAYVYISDTPRFTVNVPSTGCEGVGTITATTTHNSQTVNYAFEVQAIDTSGVHGEPIVLPKNYSQSFTGIIPDSFSFPGYYFKGGMKYLISLSVTNSCGTYTSVPDTIKIPSGVNIILERPNAYAQPVNGATSVKLHGYISLRDSFRWSPTTYLDSANILTPISTPTDSITYVLIAHSGSCVASDTVHIKYNRVANAGYNDTLCYDTNTVSTEMLIGFPYDMTLFLGMLYYYDNTQFMNHYNSANPMNDAAYFRYFTHYMHYSMFQSITSGCPTDLYNLFTNVVQKELFFKKSWFKTYYKNFTQFSDPGLPSLDDFKSAVTSDSDLKNHLDSLDSWGNIDPCMNDMFSQYNDFVMSHSTEISASWIKIVDSDTTTLSAWDNYFIAADAPVKSSTYILSAIAPSIAEIDEITILLDTTLQVAYRTGLQWDSTIYFANQTLPFSSATTYSWNFGDGGTSTEMNPIHTFPAMDSSYVVCLTATDKCGTYNFCDTVRVDSLMIGNRHFEVKKHANDPTFNSKQANANYQSNTAVKDKILHQKIVLSNYPNPFDNSTIITYEIWQGFHSAELRITDVLGRSIANYRLNKNIDQIPIDGATLTDGLYYYTIIIDGTVKQTKVMAVQH
jgi:hypothetical protein